MVQSLTSLQCVQIIKSPAPMAMKQSFSVANIAFLYFWCSMYRFEYEKKPVIFQTPVEFLA